MKWKDKLIKDILNSLDNDFATPEIFMKKLNNELVSIHLAIFNEPFLQLMSKNIKKMESRFSINSVAPYNCIAPGDLVLVKKSGGNIEAIFIAGRVKFFRNLTAMKIRELENRFGKEIGWGIDPDFLLNKSHAKYLTLIEISNFTKIHPVTSGKKDKMGWSIVRTGYQNTLFDI